MEFREEEKQRHRGIWTSHFKHMGMFLVPFAACAAFMRE